MKHAVRLRRWAAALQFVFCACAARDDAVPDRATAGVADSLVRLADSTYREDVSAAQALYTQGLEEASRTGDSASVARALTGLGMTARVQFNFAESRRLGEEALAIKLRFNMQRDLFRSYNALGLLAWYEERLTDAQERFDEAEAVARTQNDTAALARTFVNKGLVANDLGAFVRARSNYETGRDLARAALDSVTLGRALNNLAALDVTLGDPIAAIAALEEVRRLARLTADSIVEANARGQLAIAYTALGEPQRAFALLDSALAMAQRAGNPREVVEDLVLIADLFLEAGDAQLALEHYRRALAATDSVEQPEERGNVLRSEARAHAALGNPRLGLERATEALRIHRDGGFTYPELLDRIVLAGLAQRNGDPGAADEHLRTAQSIATRLEAPIALAHVGLAEAGVAGDRRQWARVLAVLDRIRAVVPLAGSGAEAESHALRARALGELGRLEAALAAGRQALASVERVRSSYAGGELRTAYVARKSGVYAQQALMLLRAGKTDEAFGVADQARGRSLLEHLSSARADVNADTTSRQVLEQETLLRKIDALVARLAERERAAAPPRERTAAFSAADSGLRDSLSMLRTEYEARTARSPTRTAELVGSARPDIRTIQASLEEDEVLLEYLVTTDRLLVFVMTRSTLEVHRIEETASGLASRVQLVRGLMAQARSDATERPVLQALHQILLGPVASSTTFRRSRRLTIVPHGVLTYLPFSALIDPATGRYVVQDRSVLHSPTSAALAALRRRRRDSVADPRASVFAPVPDRLPATKGEASDVVDVLSGSRHIGLRATEARLREALTNDGIVHVATHATLNARNPLFSHIEMAPSRRAGSTNDGRLEVHELLGMRSRASLVFLSGCETAIGGAWSTRFDAGEDYATLGQALLYAGAANVVATLWRIDDPAAALFATNMYRELRSVALPEALAAAQRAMIRDSKYGAPFFWAAYQVSGSGGANHAPLSDKR